MDKDCGNTKTTPKETKKELEVNVDWKDEKEEKEIIIIGVTRRHAGTSSNGTTF